MEFKIFNYLNRKYNEQCNIKKQLKFIVNILCILYLKCTLYDVVDLDKGVKLIKERRIIERERLDGGCTCTLLESSLVG